MLRVYAEFAEQWMAMPVIQGEKTAGERFPGAVQTFCIESMMQDRKALQAGTSHFLGQNFAKSSDIKFLGEDGVLSFAWTTSWGVSTRLVGGMLMTHSDDDGFVCPPRLAPTHVVILPVTHKAEERERVLDYCKALAKELKSQRYADLPIRVEIDDRDLRGGDKVWQWIKKGVPIRLEVGPRDIQSDSVFMARRDQPPKQKGGIARSEFVSTVADILEQIQNGLFERALAHRKAHTHEIDSKEEFYKFFTPSRKDDDENAPAPIHGGFALTHFSGDLELEEKIKADLSVTVRCIPLEASEPGTCPFTGKPSKQRVVWAKSY
ncbi:MAG: proline--tRNA ligase, partial [Myxococcaceae bacterium]|nr:proline--tRNA ligase [Myxococcaceae bacterium]